MREKWHRVLPYVFMVIAALSRWPGLFPPNFSIFYALAFCGGVFFSKSAKWWLPLGTLVATDLVLNLFYYHAFSSLQLMTYAGFAALIWFGSRFKTQDSFLKLLSGGIFGAVLFYFITNTAAWLFDPEYTKDLLGWLRAMTKGTQGFPPTIEFFRNTLLSGGLFTGLFVAALKLTAPAESPQEKKAPEPAAEAETEPDGEPEEAKA